MERTQDYVRLSLSIGIDEDLKMILDMDPGLIDPPIPRAQPQLNWSPVPSVPPTFKTATPTTRTHIKQLLMKEKALDDSRREQQQRRREEQERQEQERCEKQRQDTEIKKQTRPIPKIPQNVGVHFDVPSQVFKVKTVLENPTQYHVIEKQKMQLKQYLDEVTQMRRLSPAHLPIPAATLPMSQANSLPLTQTPGPPLPSLPPHTTSLPLASVPVSNNSGPNFTAIPSPSPDVAMSPGLSSVATSASEVRKVSIFQL